MFPRSLPSTSPRATVERNALSSSTSRRNPNSRPPASPSLAAAPSTSPASARQPLNPRLSPTLPVLPWISAPSRLPRATATPSHRSAVPQTRRSHLNSVRWEAHPSTTSRTSTHALSACSSPLIRGDFMLCRKDVRRGCVRMQHFILSKMSSYDIFLVLFL